MHVSLLNVHMGAYTENKCAYELCNVRIRISSLLNMHMSLLNMHMSLLNVRMRISTLLNVHMRACTHLDVHMSMWNEHTST